MQEKQFEVKRENLVLAQAFLDSWYEENDVDIRIATKISVCCDEIMSNVVFYSGASSMTLQCEKSDSEVSITVIDDGKAFNPLTDSKEPDITASAEDRQIGGLGIFMVKKMMSSVDYERKGDNNILTIKIGL